MKRKLLPLAIASALVAPAALADVTVYGKVNLSYQSFQEDVDLSGQTYTMKDNWELVTNASRVGVKGSHELSSNLKAIYKLEYEVFPDDGDSSGDELKARNMYGGFQGHWGTLVAGKHDTPTKKAQGDIDLFNDLTYGDIKNVMVGENRESNIIMYGLPDMGDFSATIAAMPGEDDGCSDPMNPLACDDDRDGPADGISAAAQYKADMFRVAISMDNDVQNTDLIRLAGDVSFGDVTIGALVQNAEVSDDYDVGGIPTGGIGKIDKIGSDFAGAIDSATGIDIWEEQRAYMLSVKWSLGDMALKAQYATSSTEADDAIDPTGLADFDLTMVGLGVDYKLAKNTKLYGYYAVNEAEADSSITAASVDDGEYSTFGVGVQIKF